MLGNNTKLLFIELIIKIVEHYILGCYASPRSENVVVQSLSPFWLFATPWTAASQNSLSFTISRSLLKLMSIEPVIPSNHLILCHPLLLPSSIFSSIRVFSNETALCFRWPKYWSLSISSSNSGLISLGWTGLISLLYMRLSRVFSSITVQKHQFFSVQPSLWSTLAFIHDYWKNCSSDYRPLSAK